MELPRRETAIHRPNYPGSGYETTGGPPQGVEQRGTRFPASWQPDEPSAYRITEAVERRLPPTPHQPSGEFFGLRRTRPESDETVTSSTLTPRAASTTIQQLIRYQFIYSMTSLILQLACMFIGGWLGISGVVGHTSLAAQVLSEVGLKVQMTDAGPGTVLFLVGLLTLPFTRFNVRVDK